MIDATDVACVARGYMGIPYRHLGRGKTGVDCIGLVVCVARDLGLVAEDFDVTGYNRWPSGGVLEGRLAEHLLVCARGPAPGHVVTLKINTVPFHVGIIGRGPADTPTLIHSYITTGRVCEHTLDAKWRRRISRVWAFPGVRYG